MGRPVYFAGRSNGFDWGNTAEDSIHYQDELACAVPHMLWSSVYGSLFGEGAETDAFATTMWVLRQRIIKVQGYPHNFLHTLLGSCA